MSANKNCAIIYESAATPALKVYDFSGTTTKNISGSCTVPAAIYAGITITDASVKFNVSDDCSAIRINSKLAHLDGANYAADTINYPSGVT